jgi:phosphatidylserine/phosphatidylglycerophosphate/cardiolipin synthase-like enzyme
MTCYITTGGAWCNGEVAYLAWKAQRIEGCLGFMVTRIHETGQDAGQHRILPAWVAFTDQSNPDWFAQDTSVWPIQNYEWRDLTLRRSRDQAAVRPIDFHVHYEIIPVGTAQGPERKLVPPSPTAPYKDAAGHPHYTGNPRPLYTIGTPFVTPPIDVTHTFGPSITATFTNGILSTQNLLLQLRSAAKAQRKPAPALNSTKGLLKVLQTEIRNPKSQIRAFLTADVLSFVRSLVDRQEKEGGEVYLALYELHDPELISLLLSAVKGGKIHLILSTAGSTNPNPKGTPKEQRKPVVWDTENNDARVALHNAASASIQDRMFDNKTPIGHDKFAVYVKEGEPTTVMTGSTNWTETGLCTQSNNCIIVEDKTIAKFYFDFWHRLRSDKQPAREQYTVTPRNGKPIKGAKPNNAIQGPELRRSNMRPFGPVALTDQTTKAEVWFSPNTKTANKTAQSPMPGDLNDVYTLMDHAKQAILFLTFMPGESGKQNIIGKAAKLAKERTDLLVAGAISDPSAMPNFARPAKGQPKPKTKIPVPTVWWPDGEDSRIAMIRATAISTPVGDLHPELLSAGHAIIHDKIIVIDPLDKDGCAVITGSHNLGYKASYDNDENLLIIRGNQPLALSYAVHVIDVYQHYLMRAKQEDEERKALIAGKKPKPPTTNHGFLNTNDTWQDRFFKPQPATILNYFLQTPVASRKSRQQPAPAAQPDSPQKMKAPPARKKTLQKKRTLKKKVLKKARKKKAGKRRKK